MALPQRSDPALAPTPAPTPLSGVAGGEASADYAFQPGGQVGQMQADLAARLAAGFGDAVVSPDPTERLVRFVSVAGGYTALAAAYAAVVMLVLR